MNLPGHQFKCILSNEERHDQMQAALGRFPFVEPCPLRTTNVISIVGYGPSLRQTWKAIQRPIISVSGAHRFLVEHGLTPDWHVEVDPRRHKVDMIQPQRQTKYLMASVCHPDMWDILEGHNVELWHLINDDATVDWVECHDPINRAAMIGGDSTATQRAMNVASYVLGYKRFNVYGMDCCFSQDDQHAGWHSGEPAEVIRVQIGKEVYRTSPQLLHAAREMEKFIRTTDAEVQFHGRGLMQDIAREIRRTVNAVSK